MRWNIGIIFSREYDIETKNEGTFTGKHDGGNNVVNSLCSTRASEYVCAHVSASRISNYLKIRIKGGHEPLTSSLSHYRVIANFLQRLTLTNFKFYFSNLMTNFFSD